MQALAVAGKGYDFSVEIFLQSPNPERLGITMYKSLMQIDANGKVTEKKTLRPGLEVWKTVDGGIEENWYLATLLKEPDGDSPVIACRGAIPGKGRCTGGFRWTPSISINMRFRDTPGSDWPEIYKETSKILETLRTVTS